MDEQTVQRLRAAVERDRPFGTTTLVDIADIDALLSQPTPPTDRERDDVVWMLMREAEHRLPNRRLFAEFMRRAYDAGARRG